jgi:hypothetical protein
MRGIEWHIYFCNSNVTLPSKIKIMRFNRKIDGNVHFWRSTLMGKMRNQIEKKTG